MVRDARHRRSPLCNLSSPPQFFASATRADWPAGPGRRRPDAHLKALKLGQMTQTVPERLALARQRKMSHAAFLELILADEVTTASPARRYSGPDRHSIRRCDSTPGPSWTTSLTQLLSDLTSLRSAGRDGVLIPRPVDGDPPASAFEQPRSPPPVHARLPRRQAVHPAPRSPAGQTLTPRSASWPASTCGPRSFRTTAVRRDQDQPRRRHQGSPVRLCGCALSMSSDPSAPCSRPLPQARLPDPFHAPERHRMTRSAPTQSRSTASPSPRRPARETYVQVEWHPGADLGDPHRPLRGVRASSARAAASTPSSPPTE